MPTSADPDFGYSLGNLSEMMSTQLPMCVTGRIGKRDKKGFIPNYAEQKYTVWNVAYFQTQFGDKAKPNYIDFCFHCCKQVNVSNA